jgi:hypothetical protein
MKNPRPTGPVGQDFEALVYELPYWTKERYGPSIDAINRVRKFLSEHEGKQTKVLTTQESVVSS